MRIDDKIKELYEQYGPMVYRRCAVVLRDEDAALDAMQDVFVILLTKIPRFHITRTGAYLYMMATNHCLNILKKQSRTVVDTEFINNFSTEENVEQSVVDRLTLDKLFEGISPLTRIIAGMKYSHGMKYADISEIVGLSVPAVRKRLQVLRREAHRVKEGVQ